MKTRFTIGVLGMLLAAIAGGAALIAGGGNAPVADVTPARPADVRVIAQDKPADAPSVAQDTEPLPAATEERPSCCLTLPAETLITAKNGDGAVLTKGGCCCCLDAKNLVINGDFEAGNTGVKSQYEYIKGIPICGHYSVVNEEEAQKICRQWLVKDSCACVSPNSKNTHFMVVNGETCGVGTKVIWHQDVKVTPGQKYVFCAYFRHLPQCCFDVIPKITVKFKGGNAVGNFGPTTLNTINSEKCSWDKISGMVTATGSTLSIDILLDVSGKGDGNDVAIDNICLQQVQPIDPKYLDVNYSTVHTGNFYTIKADPKITPPKNCTATWKVCEWDVVSNKCKTTEVTYPGTADFITFPTKFEDNKFYHITYTVICDNGCRQGSASWVVGYFDDKKPIKGKSPTFKKILNSPAK